MVGMPTMFQHQPFEVGDALVYQASVVGCRGGCWLSSHHGWLSVLRTHTKGEGCQQRPIFSAQCAQCPGIYSLGAYNLEA